MNLPKSRTHALTVDAVVVIVVALKEEIRTERERGRERESRSELITRRLKMEPKPMVRKRPRKESARRAPITGKKLVVADHM